MCLDGIQRLVEPEICAAADPERERDDHEQRPDQDSAQQAEPGTARRWRLPVLGDRPAGSRREHGIAVALRYGAAPDASLQCRPHTNEAAPEGACDKKRYPTLRPKDRTSMKR